MNIDSIRLFTTDTVTKVLIHDIDLPLIDYIKNTFDPKQTVLFFDDGLKSQFLALPYLKDYTVVLAITPKFIDFVKTEVLDINFSCYKRMHYRTYMDLVHKGYNIFMSKEDLISIIDSYTNVYLAIHGYTHDVFVTFNASHGLTLESQYWLSKIAKFKKLFKKYCYFVSRIAYCGFDPETNKMIHKQGLQQIIKEEIEKALVWFESNLHYHTCLFVAPFNQVSDMLIDALNTYDLLELSNDRLEVM